MKDYHDEADDDEIGDATGERGISARGAAGCRSNDERKIHPTVHEVSATSSIMEYGLQPSPLSTLEESRKTHRGSRHSISWFLISSQG